MQGRLLKNYNGPVMAAAHKNIRGMSLKLQKEEFKVTEGRV